MRYLFVAALILMAGVYTYSSSHTVYKGHDDDDGNEHGNGHGNNEGGGNNQNYLEVSTNSSLSFTLSQPSQFENTQTLFNAFKLKFKTKNSNCSMYARVSSYNVPRGASSNNIPLELSHRNNNSNNVYSLANSVHLSQYDQRLFVQKKGNQTFNFYYDLNLLPLGYDYPEGQYSFTILFTMTQP